MSVTNKSYTYEGDVGLLSFYVCGLVKIMSMYINNTYWCKSLHQVTSAKKSPCSESHVHEIFVSSSLFSLSTVYFS